MSSTSFDQDKELAEFFTDVEYLRDAFKNAAAAPTLTRRLFVIHGVGGVGKSSLLRMFRLHCKGANVPVALASGDEAKSAFDILARWTEDLKADRVTFPTFSKTFQHYREIQAKVEAQAKKAGGRTADIASKAASKTAEAAGGALAGAAIGSAIPGIGTAVGGALGGVVGGMGAEALTDWLRGFLKQPDIELLLDPAKKLTDDFLADITKAAEKRRIVLMLDTFEQMTALEDWTRDVAQRLNQNVLFVIAGRALPNWGRAWDSWQKHAYIEELKPMTEDVMRQLIQRYYATMRGGEPDPAQVEAIIRFARGLPMVVTSAVQLWVKYGVEDFQSVKAEIVANLVDRLMEGVPNTLIPALEAAAIVRWFDQPILRAVMQQDDVRELYNELRRFPFIRVRAEGLALHDAVREIMDENLRVQDSEQYRELHERAATYFEKRLEKGADVRQDQMGEEAERLGLERLYHRIRADEQKGMLIFQVEAEYLLNHHNRLRRLLNDVNTYSLEMNDSKAWREYYNARLVHVSDKKLREVEKIYQVIGEDSRIDPKLRAYALCDLGQICVRYERLGRAGGIEKAVDVLTLSQKIAPQIDSKLVFTFAHLMGVRIFQGQWAAGLGLLQQQLEYFEKSRNTFGLMHTLGNLIGCYAGWGKWKESMASRIQFEELAALNDFPYLRVRLASYPWAQIWSGRYDEAEKDIGVSLAFAQKIYDGHFVARFSKHLGLVLSLESRFGEAMEYYNQAMVNYQRLGKDYEDSVGDIHGFSGMTLMRQGRWDEAKEHLTMGLRIKESINVRLSIPEILSWTGQIDELNQDWQNAESNYHKALEVNPARRLYFQATALAGLVRVKHAQGDYAAIPPLLAEAEQLAQQYEYNDHLASLRLTQGHIAWEDKAPTWDNGFEAALHFYQHALIYALRYNRFLLDEVLSGRPQGSPLRPIIPHCLERGEEGRQMLTALREWWQTSVNDIGTPRPDTISPIPDGIPLLEAEHLAREREPGDGSPQKSVLEQIEAALSQSGKIA